MPISRQKIFVGKKYSPAKKKKKKKKKNKKKKKKKKKKIIGKGFHQQKEILSLLMFYSKI